MEQKNKENSDYKTILQTLKQIDRDIENYRDKNLEFFKQISELQNYNIDLEINQANIVQNIKLNLPGLEEEESMLLNESLNPPFNDEIPENEPINNPNSQNVSIYNDSRNMENKLLNSSLMFSRSKNKQNQNSKNYFEDLYQESKFNDKQNNIFSQNLAIRPIKNRSISNQSKHSIKKGSSIRKFTQISQNQNSLQEIRFVVDKNSSINTSISQNKIPPSREFSPTHKKLFGGQNQTIKNLKITGTQLEKIILKFVKNSEYIDRLNFKQNDFQCNPIQIISNLYQHQQLKKEIKIDLRQNGLKTSEINKKLIEKLKQSNIQILL